MKWDQISGSSRETDLVAASSLSAAQWEAAMDDQGCFGGQMAWPDMGLTTERHWLTDLWDLAAAQMPANRHYSLMSTGQALALWEQVIDASESGAYLLDRVSTARSCAAARRALLDHELLPSDQGGADWAGDAEIFLGWARRFETILDERRWVDPHSLLYRVGRARFEPARSVLLLDADPMLPAMRRLERRWRASNRTFASIGPPKLGAAVDAVIASDTNDELRLATEWAAATLQKTPLSRVAIVAPDLAQRGPELTHALSQELGRDRVWCERGEAISEMGPFGAALSVLALLSSQGGFSALSRWLRSPFFSPERPTARAIELEMRLRRDPRSDDVFVDAYRHQDLRREMLGLLPDEVPKLDSALGRIPRRATPTAWVGVWQACLRDLDWNASGAGAEAAAAWDAALAAFAELTPIASDVDGATALAEFERIAAAQSVFRPPVVHGVHLLRSISEVGPGYTGVWVMGFSDESWPEVPETVPLVPWPVRVALAMPGARPEQTLARGRLLLERLLARTPSASFSCPARRGDEPLTPCMQIGPWRRARERLERSSSNAFAARRIGSRTRTWSTDPAPRHRNDRIRGGARTLDLQAACPVRAFCETRLGAAPLEPAAQGLAPWLRGLLVHRALELLLEPAEAESPIKRIDQSIEAAFLELTHTGRPLWNVQLEIERERIRRVVDAFLALEGEREPFRTIDLERRVEITVSERSLRCRIDRIDRLPSGAQILIDYKTGKKVRNGWFEPRLTDSQLPLYAQQAPDSIGAIATIHLTSEKVEYRAAGISANSLPGRQTAFDDESAWVSQMEQWREQLATLIDEYVAGDVRLRLAGISAADGAYAPLTRVKAYLA